MLSLEAKATLRLHLDDGRPPTGTDFTSESKDGGVTFPSTASTVVICAGPKGLRQRQQPAVPEVRGTRARGTSDERCSLSSIAPLEIGAVG